ncbi:MAG: DNA-processing protein DprA [Candidatus Thorarchaeota archaeon]|jgi:hypothetical protein
MKFYAGIGSRKATTEACRIASDTAWALDKHGISLRSGGARGIDTAFYNGAIDHRMHLMSRDPDQVLYTHDPDVIRPEDATLEAIKYAKHFHPAWDRCSDYARKCHGRNMMIILGRDLHYPVDFVVYWTPTGLFTGGTGQGLRLAQDRGIKTFDLAADLPALEEYLGLKK